MEYLRTIAHLRPRANTFSAAFRVRSAAAFSIHKFFQERGFIYAHTPILTGSDCEGAKRNVYRHHLDLEDPPRGEDGRIDFSQDFFEKHTSLTVSGQLEAECMAMAFGRFIPSALPSGRKNPIPSAMPRSFWMIEPEIAFADLNDDMDLARDMMKYVIRYVMDTCPQDLQFFNQFVDKGLIDRLTHIVESDFASCDLYGSGGDPEKA